MSKIKFNSTVDVLLNTVKLVDLKDRPRLYLLGFLYLLSSFLSTVSASSFALVAAVVLDEKYIFNLKYFIYLQNRFPNIDHTSWLYLIITCVLIIVLLNRWVLIKLYLSMRTFGILLQNNLMNKLLNICLKAPYTWHLTKNPSNVSHKIINDVLSWSNDSVQRLITIVGFLSLLIFNIFLLIAFAPISGLVALCFLGSIGFFIQKKINVSIVKYSENKRRLGAKNTTVLNQIFSGIKDVKVNGNNDYFQNYFLKSFNAYGLSMVNFRYVQKLPSIAVETTAQITVLILCVIFLSKNIHGSGAIAQMSIIFIALSKVGPGISALITEVGQIKNSESNLKGIFNLLNEISEFKEKHNDVNLQSKLEFNQWKKIIFKDVVFEYGNSSKSAISNISVELENKKYYGIVGLSGSGKSTFLSIILQLLRPTSGRVYVDETPIDNFDVSSLYNKMSYVPQPFFLIDGSISSNVAFGLREDEINLIDVKKYIEAVGLMDFVGQLPNGLQTYVGEHGVGLSGGQAQRLSIARALYRKPEIIILDEATSSLDLVSEKFIYKTLEELREKTTIIIVTHKVDALKKCDEILIFDEGKICARGDFESLKKQGNVLNRFLN